MKTEVTKILVAVLIGLATILVSVLYAYLNLKRDKKLEKARKEKKAEANLANKVMLPNDYQKMAMRTCNIPYNKRKDMLRHAVFGLSSESGEVAGILQKVYQGHKFDKAHMVKELGDCLWMIAEACTALNVDLSEVMTINIEKLKSRYPEGFSSDRSLHRAKGDI